MHAAMRERMHSLVHAVSHQSARVRHMAVPARGIGEHLLRNPGAALAAVLVAALALGHVVPDRKVQVAILTVAAALAAIWALDARAANTTASIDGQTRALQDAIAAMDASGYVKNNEAIPLRDRRRFRYVFLEPRLVHLLNRLLRGFAHNYADAAYSTLFYCEAFMRQYYRILQGRVRDPSSARLLMNAALNHLHTLAYMSSVYERREIGSLREGFQGLLTGVMADALGRLDRHHELGAPAPHDPALEGGAATFELHA